MTSQQPLRLSEQQIRRYHDDGYLIVPDLLSGAEVDAFVAHQDGGGHKPYQSMALRAHTADPQWKYLAHHPRIAGGASQLLGDRPRIVQTMYLPKRAKQKPEENASIAMHQDTHYLPCEPNTLMACWIAMSDTDADNGGFCVVAASHKLPLQSTHRNVDKDHVSWEQEHLMSDRDGRKWTQKFCSFQIDAIDTMPITRLTIPRGAGVYFHGMLIHGSFANRSDRQRLAWAVHYVRQDTWVFRADVQDTILVENA